jgi:carbon-monoxide dehydrogenase small subunit
VSAHEIEVEVNGRPIRSTVPGRLTLVDYLREWLGLAGTNVGCAHGACGCCTVLLDEQPIRSCLFFAVQADRRSVTTIEGLTDTDGNLHPLQEAFWSEHGLQCGYCTPGMIVASFALLREKPDPEEQDIDSALSGNICRCTGYTQIVEAVKVGARNLRAPGDPKAAK